ncbi:MAG TPA: YceI family protein [Acidimicrobiales bacterium]|jgi:polyisoprenoid-binding protein YceI
MVTSVAERVGKWALDPSQSSVSFLQKTMWGLVPVKGVFAIVSGAGEIGTDGSISGLIEVDAASVNTKNKKRDNHLRSSDFFDVAKYAVITYRVTGASVVEPGTTVALDGELEVAGQRRPLALVADVADGADGADGGTDLVTLSATIPIERADYGLTWNKMGAMRGPTTMTIRAVFTRSTT